MYTHLEHDHGEEHPHLCLECRPELLQQAQEDGGGQLQRCRDAAGAVLEQGQAQVLPDGCERRA